MPTFRAIGVSTTPDNGTFVARVRFVQVDDAGVVLRVLSEQAFTVPTREALMAACEAQLAQIKRAHQDAARAIDIAGKVLAEVKI